MDAINLNFIPDYDALKQDPEFQRVVDALAAQHEHLAQIPSEALRPLVLDFVAAVFRHSSSDLSQD